MTGTFLLRRIASLFLVILGVTAITFSISYIAPGDPARALAGPRASPEAVEALRRDLGLDASLLQQYGNYLSRLTEGDLGTSIMTGRPVAGDMQRTLPATIELVMVCLLIVITVSLVLGSLAAVYKDRPIDYAIRALSSFCLSIPAFWLALVVLLLFYGVLDWAPGDGRIGVSFDPPPTVTGLYLVDSLFAGRLDIAADALSHLILPALTLAAGSTGGFIRVVRASMIEVLQEDYIRTALASGLRRRVIILRHALRNALIPLVTLLSMEAAALLFGAVVVESIFSWPGIGAYVLSATLSMDFPVVMAFAVVASIVYVVLNTGADLLYRALDPRLREAS